MTTRIAQQKRLIQIETTTRCLLGCPACSRTVFASALNRPYPKQDIDVDDLYNFFDCPSGREIEVLSLCGDYGDSIYYPDLFKLIERFRSTKEFVIHTAGSHRPAEFWHRLVSLLDHRDRIIFGIDGLEDTNHLYRRNSNWQSIMTAIKIVGETDIQLEWTTNIFSFNYLCLDEIRAAAEQLGCEWTCKQTSRFGDDTLRPPTEYIDSDSVYQDQYQQSVALAPQCREQRVISASGHLRPCGWITAPFTLFKSRLYHEQDLWHIKNQTMDDLLQVLDTWTDRIAADPGNADIICKMKCKPNQPATLYYEPKRTA